MSAKIMRQVLAYQGKGKYGGFYGGSAEVKVSVDTRISPSVDTWVSLGV